MFRLDVCFPLEPGPAALVTAALLLAGCAGLRTLPPAAVTGCTASETLGECIDRIPRADRRESAFRSTYRVIAGDLGRKRRDQLPKRTCDGKTPARFREVSVAMEPGIAPLRALFSPAKPGQPTVIVVHGLFDSKHAGYVTVTARSLARQGFGVLAPDMRGHGCLYSREWLPGLGVEEGADLVAWSQWLAVNHQAESVGLLGFSMGGLYVVHALSRVEAVHAFSAGGLVVSPPASLAATLSQIDQRQYFSDYGMNVFYRRAFRQATRRRLRFLRSDEPCSQCRREPPLRGFLSWLVERRIERDLPTGDGTVESFLRLAEPAPKVASAQVPLLLIASRYDPLFLGSVLEVFRTAADGNPRVWLHETPYGGHLGHLGLYPQWVADVLATFFGAAGLPAPPPPPAGN